VVVLDDALNALAQVDTRKAQVVELRFSGGLNFDETAEVLKVSAVRWYAIGLPRAPGCIAG
jgi:RNA polymerase sigma-70 factor (ECF subfamily)